MSSNNRESAESGVDGTPECNILVAIRVRPLNRLELEQGSQSVVHCPEPDTVLVKCGARDRIFSFSSTFGPEMTQQEVFNGCSMGQLISQAVTGSACTVFAFGPTGSGKTFTMAGSVPPFDSRTQDQGLHGLMHRSVTRLLEEISNKEQAFTLSASYLEIHNEQVHDLLNPQIPDSLPLRWRKDRGFHVENLRTVKFDNLDGILAVIGEGMRNRQTSAHCLNRESSRSHCILTVEIGIGPVDPKNGSNSSKWGKLRFVDLAGSERVKETGASDKTLVEAMAINRSLLALGNCIMALVDPKRNNHIPYRDSKLTKLLADCLGGNGVCLMIACVSPSPLSLMDTMNTLRFASRARKIRNKPAVCMDAKDKVIRSLQQDAKLLCAENAFLWRPFQLLSPGTACPGHNTRLHQSTNNLTVTETGERRDFSLLPSSEDSLYWMLQEFLWENESLREQNKELLRRMKNCQQEQQITQHRNRQLLWKLQELERLILSSPHGNTGFTWENIERLNDSPTAQLPSPPLGTLNYSRTPAGQVSQVFPVSNRCGSQEDQDQQQSDQTLHHRNKSHSQIGRLMDQHQRHDDKKLLPHDLLPASYNSVVPSAPPLPTTPDHPPKQ
ncbi:kinesin-like protein KIF12 [Carcharodon carcharias]|uniref:kinesin-like protein KIF12 n=1 Tax=Carcharodon carcharias TaxID=13397 RepID=UPI001B7DB018|nr:kinesin-like protein KIF12 [Carcharodon carcharias]